MLNLPTVAWREHPSPRPATWNGRQSGEQVEWVVHEEERRVDMERKRVEEQVNRVEERNRVEEKMRVKAESTRLGNVATGRPLLYHDIDCRAYISSQTYTMYILDPVTVYLQKESSSNVTRYMYVDASTNILSSPRNSPGS